MHLIIVEDLDADRDRLACLIQENCPEECPPVDFSFYESGEAFLDRYRFGSCDALFLDVLLGGMTGIDIAAKIREKEPRLPIIFTTNEPDFALDGFAVHAMDYLVKPLKPAKVAWCLKELCEYIATPSSVTVHEADGRGHSRTADIALDDIIYAQCRDHSMEIHTVSGVVMTRLSFQEFTSLLPHSGRFYVCGRGLVVNFSHVSRVADRVMSLKNGDSLAFAANRREEVRKAFSSWLFSRTRKGGWA